MSISSEDIYRCLAEHSADGLIVTDRGGTILALNPSVQRLIGRTTAEVAGRSLETVIECSCSLKNSTGGGGTDGAKQLLLAETDSAGVHNVSVVNENGLEITMPANHAVIRNASGDLVGYLTVIYIIQAGSVQQAQTEFVSTVSHELRTPLTSIKGFADTILRAGDRLDSSQQRRYVGIIKDQADRLTRLVEDLLAVSRLESKKLQLTIRAIDLGEAVQRVCRNLADKAREHQVLTRIPPGLPPVWADADRLEQILTNLIDNAIKYSPPRTTVTISAREIGQTPEIVEFSVSDQGVGIPAEHLPHIFSKFSRLDNPLVRQTEGTGLGLYITKSLVLALGGQIKVDSGVSGTTFTVQLPAATLEEQAARGRGLS